MKALLIVDMQVACIEGATPRRRIPEVIANLNALAQAARAAGGVVVHIQHTDPLEGFERGSRGWQIVSGIEVLEADLRLEKGACDSFLHTGLDARLRSLGVDTLLIGGCATDFCVDTTVRTAAALGYEVLVASDAHTTGDRPHLSADKVIEHHEYLWRELLLPERRTIKVRPTAEILPSLAAGA